MYKRKFDSSEKDLQKHGYLGGGPGCKAKLTGRSRQGHREKCRKRREEAMAGEKKVKTSKERVNKFLEEAMEKERYSIL